MALNTNEILRKNLPIVKAMNDAAGKIAQTELQKATEASPIEAERKRILAKNSAEKIAQAKQMHKKAIELLVLIDPRTPSRRGGSRVSAPTPGYF